MKLIVVVCTLIIVSVVRSQDIEAQRRDKRTIGLIIQSWANAFGYTLTPRNPPPDFGNFNFIVTPVRRTNAPAPAPGAMMPPAPPGAPGAAPPPAPGTPQAAPPPAAPPALPAQQAAAPAPPATAPGPAPGPLQLTIPIPAAQPAPARPPVSASARVQAVANFNPFQSFLFQQKPDFNFGNEGEAKYSSPSFNGAFPKYWDEPNEQSAFAAPQSDNGAEQATNETLPAAEKSDIQEEQTNEPNYFSAGDSGNGGSAHSSVKMHDSEFNYLTYHGQQYESPLQNYY